MWAGYELPDLGLTAAEPVAARLEAVYWDTADLRLLRRGVTIREEAGEWTLRGPDGESVALDGGAWRAAEAGGARGGSSSEAGAASRASEGGVSGGRSPEFEARAPRDGVLPAVALGWTLGAPLRELARLATVRESFALSDGRGELALLALDEVSLLRGERVAARFRELELTPLDGAPPRLMARIEARLREAGAQPVDAVPKVVRGLAPAALEPPPPAPPEPGPDASAGDVIRARLAASLERWAEHQAPLHLDGTPESVRGLRAGIRGLRRDLRIFTPVVDAREALGRVLDPLTTVRRLDRLVERAAEQGLDALAEALTADRGRALAVARDVLSGPRYAALLRETAALVDRPPLPARIAERPAAEVLPALVRAPLRRLRRAAADDPGRRRKLVDRLAAAATAAAPYADARAGLAELEELRVVLREHRHATTAIEALAALASRSPEHAWEAGFLAGAERTRAAEASAAVSSAFARATRRKLWAWVP